LKRIRAPCCRRRQAAAAGVLWGSAGIFMLVAIVGKELQFNA
jgi:hypothetical protein